MSQIKLLLANPMYPGGLGCMSVRPQLTAIARHPDWIFHRMEIAMSLLTANFNTFWARALNLRDERQLTHVLLLHADVSPRGDDWLDVLFREMAAHQAGVLSAIIPLKDARGLTSTALDTHPWRPTRLTRMQILHEYPETWTREDLLFNTGCLLVDFRQPWVEQVCFTMRDKIERNEQGRWQAYVESEDWNFSRRCRTLGVRAYVTRAVPIDHFGLGCWSSDTPTGWLQDAQNLRAPHVVAVTET